MHNLNDKQGHYKSLFLMPDHSSTGIWCSCGVEVSDPLETTNIPYDLIELVGAWNLLWEHMSMYPENINVNVIEKKIISTGRILADKISRYVSCTLAEDRCKLNIVQWKKKG